MTNRIFRIAQHSVLMLLLLGFFWNCTTSKVILRPEVKQDQSVKIFTRANQVLEGIVIQVDEEQLTLISTANSQKETVPFKEIRRIERSDKVFDYNARPISKAEIEKFKGSRNTLGYAAGGAAIGGLAGLAIGLPIWLSQDNPPPLFAAGIGAVLGSIYFGVKGMRRDEDIAIQKVRYFRRRETDLVKEKQKEEQRLKEIELEKQRLKEELEKKKKKKDGSESG